MQILDEKERKRVNLMHTLSSVLYVDRPGANGLGTPRVKLGNPLRSGC